MINFRLAESDLPGLAFAKVYRGGITYVLNRGMFLPEQAAALTVAAGIALETVAHFQIWNGEIVELGPSIEEPSALHGVRQR
ncbi:hypothetical protein [Streptomyces sp. NBC_00842]|uniref:hypothetical protein n=1 Tax=Streptomyces sp. NBC_00842 TaxID=2975848 RepID=UPI003867718A|nr:hypothetical protein OH821_21890 [Streptomyces sp. NBC_00842]